MARDYTGLLDRAADHIRRGRPESELVFELRDALGQVLSYQNLLHDLGELVPQPVRRPVRVAPWRVHQFGGVL